MAVNIDKLVETRTGEALEAELRKKANFLEKQKEWRDAIKKFNDMVSMSHEEFLSLQSVEDVFLEYNSAYGETAYRMGYSDGVMVGMEQEPDGIKSVLTFEDMKNLICVYDAVRQLEKILLGRSGEHWEDVTSSSVYERVFNIICNATCTKIKLLEDDKAIDFITEVLSDDTMAPGKKAGRLLGIDDGLKRDERILIEWYRENPLSVYIELALMVMTEIDIMTEEEYKKYKKRAEENADTLKEYMRKGGNELSWLWKN